MRLAYFDCFSGISGDMTLGALIDLGVPLLLLDKAIQSVLPQVRLESEQVVRKGFRATLAKVIAPAEHVHRHLATILDMIDAGRKSGVLSDKHVDQASDVFRLIAEAEAFVHGTDVESVHFHEVGAADSIADIVGAVVGLDYLDVDEIHASPVPTGCGEIEIAHGKCSIPAPATARLLRGIPIAASDVPCELTTPTGAALLKYFVHRFGPAPSMVVSSIGVGAGSRDLLQQANILRVLIGDMLSETKHLHAAAEYKPEASTEHRHDGFGRHEHRHEHQTDLFPTPLPSATMPTTTIAETAWMLETNIDDLSGEVVGHCVEKLWTFEPLDVWTTPVQMKKQRPGVTLSVLCRRDQIERIESLLFAETTTLGIRRWPVERTILHRETCDITTPWGPLQVKRATLPDGTEKIAPEFESVKRLAAERKVSVREIFDHLSGR